MAMKSWVVFLFYCILNYKFLHFSIKSVNYFFNQKIFFVWLIWFLRTGLDYMSSKISFSCEIYPNSLASRVSTLTLSSIILGKRRPIDVTFLLTLFMILPGSISRKLEAHIHSSSISLYPENIH